MTSHGLASLTSHAVAESLVTQLRSALLPDINISIGGDTQLVVETVVGSRMVFDIALIADQDAGDRDANLLTAVRSFLNSLQDLVVRHRSREWPENVVGSAQVWADDGVIQGGYGRSVGDATPLVTISAP